MWFDRKFSFTFTAGIKLGIVINYGSEAYNK